MKSVFSMQKTISQTARPKYAAELLGISISTLWRWAKERRDFPRARQLSRRCTVFDTAELLTWRDSQCKDFGQ